MKRWFKRVIIGTAIPLIAGSLVYSVEDVTAVSTFRQGLQFKVEDIADSDKNGSLGIEEMVAVCSVLELDPVERLRHGFYLAIEESQRYLKSKGKFDPKTDTTYDIRKQHPSFTKAEVEGKPVYYPKF